MRLYIHTIDGKPAFFSDGQLCYAELRDYWQDDYPLVLARFTIDAIRNDQRRHRAYRTKRGWEIGELDFIVIDTKAGWIKWRGAR